MPEDNQHAGLEQPLHRRQRPEGDARMLRLRNLLNILFLVTAAVGLYLYLKSDRQTGTLVILGAMVFKMADAAIRMTSKFRKDQ